jgi:sugar fermentation stimulation protein A
MDYPHPLVEGFFVRRYKRFLCDVRIDGVEITAHIANTGSMTACTAPHAPVRLSKSDNPKRKLAWSVEQIQVGGHWIVVNTARPNAVVAEGIASGAIPELSGYATLKREQRLGESRVDILLEDGARKAWVEVKNATLLQGDALRFPDAVTARGTRHLRELAAVVGPQTRAVLLFHVGHEGGSWVEPAADIDPEYARTLVEAMARGVEVLAYRTAIDAERLVLAGPVPLRIEGTAVITPRGQ